MPRNLLGLRPSLSGFYLRTLGRFDKFQGVFLSKSEVVSLSAPYIGESKRMFFQN